MQAPLAATQTQKQKQKAGSPETDMRAASYPAGVSMTFQPSELTCAPRRESDVEGSWQTSAPREPASSGAPVTLGLRNAVGTGTRTVEAWVYGPNDQMWSARTQLIMNHWTEVVFPRHFRPAPQRMPSGTYTVIWRSGEPKHPFIMCDGFVVN